MGPARGPRGLPRLAPHPRRVRRRPDGRGRGLDPDAGAHRGVRPSRRAPAGLQLRLAAGEVERRRHGRLHPPYVRDPRPGRRQPDVGALEPRRRAARDEVRRRPRRRGPRPRRDAGDAGAARLVVPLPGRGARPRERRRPGGAATGPGLVPHRRRVARPLPRADAVEGHQGAVRLRRAQAAVAADARGVGRPHGRGADRQARVDAGAVPQGAEGTPHVRHHGPARGRDPRPRQVRAGLPPRSGHGRAERRHPSGRVAEGQGAGQQRPARRRQAAAEHRRLDPSSPRRPARGCSGPAPRRTRSGPRRPSRRAARRATCAGAGPRRSAGYVPRR